MRFSPLFLLVAAVPSLGLAEDYLGAEKALNLIANSNEKAVAKQDAVATLAADLEAYRKEAPRLEPSAAVAKWLELLARQGQLSRRGYSQSWDRVRFPSFVEALFPPAAWQDAEHSVSAPTNGSLEDSVRREALLWFLRRLQGKPLAENYKAILAAGVAATADNDSYLGSAIDRVGRCSIDVAPADEVLPLLAERLVAATSRAEKSSSDSSELGDMPDLATLAGEEKAGGFLARALTTFPGEIELPDGATAALGRRIALEQIAKLKAPQWELTRSLDGGALFAALRKRFPGGNTYEYKQALNWEIARLLLEGRLDDARKLARDIQSRELSMPSEILDRAQALDRLEPFVKFFREKAEQNPSVQILREYGEIAVREGGDGAGWIDLLKAIERNPNIDAAQKEEISSQLRSAFLAVGKVDEAAALLKKDLTPSPGNDAEAALDAAIQLAVLGRLLDKPEWIDTGVTAARDRIAEATDPYRISDGARLLARLQLDLGRGPEAERTLVSALRVVESSLTEQQPRIDPRSGRMLLAALAGVYLAADRGADVVTLAREASRWGATDAAQLIDLECYIGGRRSISFPVCLAKALAQTGDKATARRIVTEVLPFVSGEDAAYALLVELDGADAISELDRLFALDQFQERPLIWKAQVLLDAGKIDKAESAARAAIRIDPSDGEEGPGDRMRVYAVLADILDRRGQAKDATFFRNVVKSIRTSEEADEFYEAGLIRRSVEMHEESLMFFADAYCVQSRLAIRLANAGDWKGAEEHYRRAYELMPSSFGRVESHCFGCERAFAGERQKSLAERTFEAFAKAHPENPQVHYLLGYLCVEADRYADALAPLRKAVELDPDYLNAWEKLSTVAARLHLPAEEQGRIVANLIRLDPSLRHVSLDLDPVANLAPVWELLEKAAASTPRLPTTVFPLPAAAKFVASLPADSPYRRGLESDYGRERDANDPGSIFARQSFTSAAQDVLDSLRH
jgi:tetratricopeptide (TPR) repeat protein